MPPADETAPDTVLAAVQTLVRPAETELPAALQAAAKAKSASVNSEPINQHDAADAPDEFSGCQRRTPKQHFVTPERHVDRHSNQKYRLQGRCERCIDRLDGRRAKGVHLAEHRPKDV